MADLESIGTSPQPGFRSRGIVCDRRLGQLLVRFASFRFLAHDPEKCVAVFPRDKRECVCAEIMRKQQTKARWQFDLKPSSFSLATSGWDFRQGT